jgi:hypothetical protein
MASENWRSATTAQKARPTENDNIAEDQGSVTVRKEQLVHDACYAQVGKPHARVRCEPQ